jgi:hypothetical protein
VDIDSALRQIRTGWKLLELIFCKDTIAAKWYQYGETMLVKLHRYCFAKVLESDKLLFLVRFVHLLDSVFQAFLYAKKAKACITAGADHITKCRP